MIDLDTVIIFYDHGGHDLAFYLMDMSIILIDLNDYCFDDDMMIIDGFICILLMLCLYLWCMYISRCMVR